MWRRSELIRDEKGVALVLTLVVIALLVSLVVDFSYTMHVELTLAANMRDETKALYAARSGVEVAKLLLLEDEKEKDEREYDALDEEWAHFDENPGFLSEDDEGRFQGTIEDEAGKFPINDLINEDGGINEERRKQLERLFEVLELDLDLVDPICDWLDSNHDEGPNGAEDSYYAGFSPPYPCKDGPLFALEELLLVKGMTEEILYGTDEKKGLIHYLTIYTDGKININTATAEVLQSLSEDISEYGAQAVIDSREEEPFQDINCDILDKLLEISSDICTEIDDYIGVQSSTFSVRMEGQVRGIKKRIVTVLNRKGETVTPVFWRVE
jgi:general secretion pathway protein K